MGHRLFEVVMNHQALARKWRPKRFEDVVGQRFAVQALTNALTQNFLHHAYLFTGTRGVGKTTIARILAKCLNCETGITATPCEKCPTCNDINNGCFPDLFEIDAASRTKVEDTRDILDNVQYAATSGRFKIYLIDEVHMLSGHSFNALLKTLEEPPEHVKFLLATTDPQKLPATVLSRCLQFHLSHLTVDEINQQLKHILNAEKIQFELEATQLISQAANGSLRDALSLLDQSIAYGNGSVLTDNTRGMLGTIDQTLILDLLNGLADQDANKLVTTTAKLNEHGIDFSSALKELLASLHTITLLQLAPEQVNDATFSELASKITKEDVQLYYQIGLIGQRDLNYAPSLQSGFEMTLLRMLAFTPNKQNSQFEIRNSDEKQNSNKQTLEPEAQNSIKKQSSAQIPQDWNALFSQLSLTGAARMLAEQCSIIKKDDTSIALGLNPKHKALLQDAMVRRINESLNNYLNRTIHLTITLTESSHDTPRDNEIRKTEQQQQNAEQAIYNDDKVQQIIKAFDAKIIKESIKPIK
jgi:DNA polymerase-3 subunit gamma/tau